MEKEEEEEMKRLFAIFVVVVLPLAFALGLAADEKKEVSLPDDWRSYTHVKSMVIPDKNHGLYGFHHVYVNGKGLATLKGGGSYPEGSIFIAVFYDVNMEKDGSVTQGKKLRYVYMRKDASAKETGDWEYAVFDADGKFVEKDTKKCYECHTGVKSSDFIFSKFIE